MGSLIERWFANVDGDPVEMTLRWPTVAPAGEPFDVIVGLIQSNMKGAATDYNSGDQYPSAISMWDWSVGAMVPAIEPTSNLDLGAPGMGAGNTFVKDYFTERLAAGRRLLYVNAAIGGTGFSLPSTSSGHPNYTWDRTLTDDSENLALRTRDRLNAIMASLPAGSEFVALLANHGSTDGTNAMSKATFKAKLGDWVNWIRSQIGAPNVPYVMMQMRPSLLTEGRHNNIDSASQEIAADPTYINVGFATSPNGTEYNKADSVHFNALGVRTIGHSMFDVFDAM